MGELATEVVLNALVQVASQNSCLLKQAEEQLREWEVQQGFHSVLLDICMKYNLDLSIRWQAAIYFKNGVDKYWRMQAPNCIQEDEKVVIRRKLISSFNESFTQVALQLALAVSKIARLDCPSKWPELMPTLLEAIASADDLVQHRALLVMHHVIKSLASKRFTGGRRDFQELTSGILSFILNTWNIHTERFFSEIQNGTDVAIGPLRKATFCLKILRWLIVSGLKEPHKVEDAVLFMQMMVERLKTTVGIYRAASNAELSELCNKNLVSMTKVLLDVLDIHPYSFVQFIRPTLEFTLNYVVKGEGDLSEKFTVQCLWLMKCTIMCEEYRMGKSPRGDVHVNPMAFTAHNFKKGFFTTEALTEIVRVIVTKYFMLTREDLEEWDTDPENFAVSEGGQSEKDKLIPCAEVLFVSLFYEFREVVTPIVLQIVELSAAPCDPSDLSQVLRKDSAYHAMYLAAPHLYDEVNFEYWFHNILSKELGIRHPTYRIVHHQVLLVIAEWARVKVNPELHSCLCQWLLPFMSPEQDTVVRMTAAYALKSAFDDFEFNVDNFEPYLETCIGHMFQLLKDMKEGNTKMRVLHVFSFILERVIGKIRPFIGSIVDYLPSLWQQAVEHNLLRCAILAFIERIVRGLGTDCVSLYGFIIPLIRLSVDTKQEAYVYLLEDGLCLWDTALELAVEPHQQLVSLFAYIPPLLGLASENLKTAFHLVQKYVVLGAAHLIQSYAPVVCEACKDLFFQVNMETYELCFKTIEVFMRCIPAHATQLFRPFIHTMIKAIITRNEDYLPSTTTYSSDLSVIGRAIITDMTSFNAILDDVAIETQKTSDDTLLTLLQLNLEKMQYVAQPERRKLIALAVGSLFTTRPGLVGSIFFDLVKFLIEVLNDIINDDGGAQIDSMLISDDDLIGDDDYDTEHDKRKRRLRKEDPVHTVSLKEYVANQVSAFRAGIGNRQFEELYSTLDNELIQNIHLYFSV